MGGGKRRTYFPDDIRRQGPQAPVVVYVLARMGDQLEQPPARPPKTPARHRRGCCWSPSSPRYVLPDDQLATRRFCRATWDVHEARGRTISFTSTWPGPRDFRRHWPGLAGSLTVADWKVRESSTFSSVLEVDWEHLDPPAPEERDWAVLYASELETLPGLHFHLVPTDESDVGGVGRATTWIMKQLRHLPVREQTALRLWLGGDSRSEIARKLSRYGHGVRPDQVARLLDVDGTGRPRALRDFLAARLGSSTPDSVAISKADTP